MSRRVVVLGLLVLLVGGWVLLRELPGIRDDEERAAAELLVFERLPGVIDTLRIDQASREILVVRDGDRWWLRSPIVEEVPAINVENLIERLGETQRWRRVAREVPEEEWALYGLAEDSPGRVRIELVGPAGRSAIDVGELTAGSGTVWVRRVGSGELWLCLEDLYDIANMTHQGLRNPRLFDVTHDDLVRIRFSAGQNAWTAVRDDQGLWHLGSIDGPRLKRWVLEEFAFTVAGMRVDGYLRDGLQADDWSAYGLDRPWGQVDWEDDEGHTATVWFGNELGGGLVFGRRSGLDSVFRLAPEITRGLEVDPDSLVDRNPIGGNFLRSEKIRVHVDAGFVDVVRQTPGVQLFTEAGALAPDEYAQVAGRNLQLGLEEMQPLAEMMVPSDQDPVALLDHVEGRLDVVWPDRRVEVIVGQRGAGAWIAIGGESSLWQVDRGMLLRLREVQALH
jgi:hypothetical protein